MELRKRRVGTRLGHSRHWPIQASEKSRGEIAEGKPAGRRCFVGTKRRSKVRGAADLRIHGRGRPADKKSHFHFLCLSGRCFAFELGLSRVTSPFGTVLRTFLSAPPVADLLQPEVLSSILKSLPNGRISPIRLFFNASTF